MATSYTTNLGLALPVTSELAGTWGDVVNQEITELLDNAIAGTTTLSSDADVTLTTTTGAANEARQAILLWTASGTATRTITAPARTKAYIVINATGGTQSIKLVGVGPTTGITIVAGEKCLAAWNGSDFVKVASNLISGLSGTLATTNGGTGLTSFTANGVVYASSTSALTTGSALTFDGANLSLATGKVTTSAAGTSAGFQWGGTTTTSRLYDDGAGAVYLDVGAGASNADVPLFVRTKGAGNIAFQPGGISAYSLNSSVHVWNISGSEQMRLTSTGLGIGTSSPGYKLDVAGTSGTLARFTNTSANQSVNVAITAGTNSHAYQTITRSNVSYDAQQVWVPSGALSSSNPQWGAGFSFNDSGNNWKLTTYDGGTTTTDRLVVSTSGNLGLGVTPSAWGSNYRALQVRDSSNLHGVLTSGDGATSVGSNYYYNGTNNIYVSSWFATKYQQLSGVHSWYTAPSGTAGDPITFTQAMTLDASGDLVVGRTDNPGSARANFYGSSGTTIRVGDAVNANWRGYVIGAGGNDPAEYGFLKLNANSGELQLYVGPVAYGGFQTFYTAGTERARIDASGNVGIGLTPSGSYKLEVSGTAAATDFNSTSDRNKKTNIATLQDSLTKVQALRGVEFDWKDTGKHSVGLIAQEVEAVIPEAVQGEEGNKTVSYGNLVGLLIEAIKEQQTTINALTARVAQLEQGA